MVAGLLRHAGVYLGEEGDFLPAMPNENPEGFWEHFGFYALNERLLTHLGAGWDMPELPAGWETAKDLDPFRADAMQLIERMESFAKGAVWAWKDPRNSITLPFWKSLIPGLRTVVCVRNPLEVALSLQKRNNFSIAASARLWVKYYQSILSHAPARGRVFTYYENYFQDASAELGRVLTALGLPAEQCEAALAAGFIKPEHYHHHATQGELLSSEICPGAIDLLAQLHAMGPQAPADAEKGDGDGEGDANLLRSRFHAETAQREEHIRQLIQENTLLRKSLGKIEKEVSEMRAERDDHARKFSAMAARAVAVHGLIAQKRAQYAFLQTKVESTLKDTKPLIPRPIRFSNTVNSIYRIFKRVRKMGKLFTLQRELNDNVVESLGTLTHITTVLAGQRVLSDEDIPAGLAHYSYEKTNMDVPELMEALRMRLS